MQNPTFIEQFNKLVIAYLGNKVNPWDNCACFVGNLLNNNGDWYLSAQRARRYAKFNMEVSGFPSIFIPDEEGRNKADICLLQECNNFYTHEEIAELEYIFLRKIWGKFDHEQALFEAFEVALLRLKEIHESKGEIVDNYLFKKRELTIV